MADDEQTETPDARHITKEEWTHILARHSAWLTWRKPAPSWKTPSRWLRPGRGVWAKRRAWKRMETHPKRCRLRGGLRGTVLPPGADLTEADLAGVDLSGAILRNVILEGAVLHDVRFEGADLVDAVLSHADLQCARLDGARNLTVAQLGGTDLRGATLPKHIAEFGGVDYIAELSKNASNLFLSTILAAAFMLLTLGRTQDFQFLTTSQAGATILPVINAQIATIPFFFLGPIVLLVLFLSFQLSMQRLWEAMADLPAIFPDGLTVDRKTYPWLLNDLVRVYFRQLRIPRRPLFWFQQRLFRFLTYGLIPLTAYPFLARCLCLHWWVMTGLHSVVLATLVVTALLFSYLAAITLRRDRLSLTRWVTARSSLWRLLAARHLLAFLVCLAVLGGGAGWLFAHGGSASTPLLLGYGAALNIPEAQLSTKPSGWSNAVSVTEKAKLVERVQGANLRGRDFAKANAQSVFLVNADLSETNLSGSRLIYAALSHANLIGANLRGANLAHADLTHATLTDADASHARLNEADLSEARLNGIHLYRADVTRANLSRADLTRADLSGIYLSHANLTGADLSDDNLSDADLTDTDLSGAYFANANLAEARFHGSFYCLGHPPIGLDMAKITPQDRPQPKPGTPRASMASSKSPL